MCWQTEHYKLRVLVNLSKEKILQIQLKLVQGFTPKPYMIIVKYVFTSSTDQE